MALSPCARPALTCFSRWSSCARRDGGCGDLACAQRACADALVSRRRLRRPRAGRRSGDWTCAPRRLTGCLKPAAPISSRSSMCWSPRHAGRMAGLRFAIRAADGTRGGRVRHQLAHGTSLPRCLSTSSLPRGAGDWASRSCRPAPHTCSNPTCARSTLWIKTNAESVAIAQALGYTDTGVRERALRRFTRHAA